MAARPIWPFSEIRRLKARNEELLRQSYELMEEMRNWQGKKSKPGTINGEVIHERKTSGYLMR